MIAILRDNLIIVADENIRPDMLRALREFLHEKEIDLHVIAFNTQPIVDYRDAPPEVTEAALLVQSWFEERRAHV